MENEQNIKTENRIQTALALFLSALVITMLAAGCGFFDDAKKQEIKDAVHSAIIEFVETKGQQEVYEYIDKLVEEGKLGSSNAERLKAAVPQGIEKLKEVMGEIEKEEKDNE